MPGVTLGGTCVKRRQDLGPALALRRGPVPCALDLEQCGGFLMAFLIEQPEELQHQLLATPLPGDRRRIGHNWTGVIFAALKPFSQRARSDSMRALNSAGVVETL